MANKIVSTIIDALFRSCSKKKKPPDTLDRSRHPVQQQGSTRYEWLLSGCWVAVKRNHCNNLNILHKWNKWNKAPFATPRLLAIAFRVWFLCAVLLPPLPPICWKVKAGPPPASRSNMLKSKSCKSVKSILCFLATDFRSKIARYKLRLTDRHKCYRLCWPQFPFATGVHALL